MPASPAQITTLLRHSHVGRAKTDPRWLSPAEHAMLSAMLTEMKETHLVRMGNGILIARTGIAKDSIAKVKRSLIAKGILHETSGRNRKAREDCIYGIYPKELWFTHTGDLEFSPAAAPTHSQTAALIEALDEHLAEPALFWLETMEQLHGYGFDTVRVANGLAVLREVERLEELGEIDADRFAEGLEAAYAKGIFEQVNGKPLDWALSYAVRCAAGQELIAAV